METGKPLPESGEAGVRQPKKAAQAVVRCEGFQCMAYRDKDGAWRSVADDKELQVLEVVMPF
jgi:hypothetical protein